MIFFAVLFTLLLGVCIFVGLPNARKWQRMTSVATFFLLAGVVYAGSIDLMGAPKPIQLEWRAPDKPTVIAARMREGEAIYVWLQSPDAKEPRSYVLPWNTQTAQQLQDALREGESRGTAVEMKLTRPQGGDDGVPKFYAQPQRPLPRKDRQGGGAAVFKHPENRP
jgi:hypothetical protein